MAIQWMSRFTLSPSRSGYLSLAFLPAYRTNAERLSEGLAAVGRGRGVVCPPRGSALSPRVIFHACCTNPSLVNATSTRSHSLGGRARHEFQCSDGQSVALFTSLSWKSWGIREEAGLQGTWEQHRMTTQLHHPRGQAMPASLPSATARNDRSQRPNSQNPMPTILSASI